jgi:hypothetical protein
VHNTRCLDLRGFLLCFFFLYVQCARGGARDRAVASRRG